MAQPDLLDQLERDGALILDTIDAGDADLWDAPVPGLQWDVRTVVTHLGAVHRWSADLVRRVLATNETGGSRAFWPEQLTDADLPAWFAEGLAGLVATLRAAPPGLACYTMLDDVGAREFWVRRQVHETAVHRADVQAAAGRTPAEIGADLPVEIAQGGLAEIVGGFARKPAFAAGRPAVLALRADDGPGWLVEFADSGNQTRLAAANDDLDFADAVVSGTSAQLYLWAWNRPAEVVVGGDPAVADLWRRVAIG